MPARNAPSAIDTPNSLAEPTAIPSANTSTVSVNSSRERVQRDVLEQLGNHALADDGRERDQRADLERRRCPAPWRCPRRSVIGPVLRAPGSSTNTNTVKMSSTTSQPTATWPACVCRRLLSVSMRKSTTVLATEIARPNTKPGAHRHA